MAYAYKKEKRDEICNICLWKHYESEKGMTSHALFRIYKSKDTSKMQLMIVKRGKLLTSSLSRMEGCKHQIKDHTPSATKAA